MSILFLPVFPVAATDHYDRAFLSESKAYRDWQNSPSRTWELFGEIPAGKRPSKALVVEKSDYSFCLDEEKRDRLKAEKRKVLRNIRKTHSDKTGDTSQEEETKRLTAEKGRLDALLAQLEYPVGDLLATETAQNAYRRYGDDTHRLVFVNAETGGFVKTESGEIQPQEPEKSLTSLRTALEEKGLSVSSIQANVVIAKDGVGVDYSFSVSGVKIPDVYAAVQQGQGLADDTKAKIFFIADKSIARKIWWEDRGFYLLGAGASLLSLGMVLFLRHVIQKRSRVQRFYSLIVAAHKLVKKHGVEDLDRSLESVLLPKLQGCDDDKKKVVMIVKKMILAAYNNPKGSLTLGQCFQVKKYGNGRIAHISVSKKLPKKLRKQLNEGQKKVMGIWHTKTSFRSKIWRLFFGGRKGISKLKKPVNTKTNTVSK